MIQEGSDVCACRRLTALGADVGRCVMLTAPHPTVPWQPGPEPTRAEAFVSSFIPKRPASGIASGTQ